MSFKSDLQVEPSLHPVHPLGVKRYHPTVNQHFPLHLLVRIPHHPRLPLFVTHLAGDLYHTKHSS